MSFLNLFLIASIPQPKNALGIIGDAFKKLFDIIIGAVKFVVDGIWNAIKWVAQQIANLFQSLIDLLISFFTVIFDLIKGILYFLAQILILIGKFFMILLETAKLAWSFIVGIGRTMAQLVYSPVGSSAGNAYSSDIGKVMTYANNYMQLKPLANILLFLVWITMAMLVLRIISSIRNA